MGWPHVDLWVLRILQHLRICDFRAPVWTASNVTSAGNPHNHHAHHNPWHKYCSQQTSDPCTYFSWPFNNSLSKMRIYYRCTKIGWLSLERYTLSPHLNQAFSKPIVRVNHSSNKSRGTLLICNVYISTSLYQEFSDRGVKEGWPKQGRLCVRAGPLQGVHLRSSIEQHGHNCRMMWMTQRPEPASPRSNCIFTTYIWVRSIVQQQPHSFRFTHINRPYQWVGRHLCL